MMTAVESALERVNSASELKELGNAAFKNGDYQAAISHYVKMFLYINGLEQPQVLQGLASSSLPQEISAQIKALQLSASLNLAVAYLKLQNASKAIEFANKALVIEENNCKGLYRRGCAYLLRNEFDDARADLERVLQISPDDKAAATQLRQLKIAERNYNAKLSSKMSERFAQMDLS